MTNKAAIRRIERNICSHMDLCGYTDCEKCEVELAIEALERQIPKKPIDNIEREWFECPTCGRVIVTYYAGERHHCKCGQALNWEGIE